MVDTMTADPFILEAIKLPVSNRLIPFTASRRLFRNINIKYTRHAMLLRTPICVMAAITLAYMFFGELKSERWKVKRNTINRASNVMASYQH